MSRPTMIDESNGIRRMFWSCPVKFIPASVLAFLKHRHFYEKHPSAPFPVYRDVSPRYMQSEMIFDYELSLYMIKGD